MINMQLRKYIECTKEEKKPLLNIINEMVVLANVARQEGILALEQRAQELDDMFMKTGLELIIDGTDSEIVRDIMETTIITSFKTGAELIKQIITVEGLLGVQAGENPRNLEMRLLAYLGGDFTSKDLEPSEEETEERYKKLISEQDSLSLVEGLPEFENILKLSNRDIQFILREIDRMDFIFALKGASKELRNHFFNNISRRLCVSILKSLRNSSIEKNAKEHTPIAQQKILDTIKKLQESGEIATQNNME